jgi:hypothetical protein
VIFKPELVKKILAGEKTVTRRPAKQLQSIGLANIYSPSHYKPGKEYAVQPGRGKKGVARIRIKRVNLEALGIIDQDEARAEGFASVYAFAEYWAEIYCQWEPTRLVHRIEFELVR